MKRFLALLCMAAMLLSLPLLMPLTADAAQTVGEGLSFKATDDYQLTNMIERGQLKTIDITFKLPKETTKANREALLGDLVANNVEGFFIEKGNQGNIHFYAWMKEDPETNLINWYEFWVGENGDFSTGDWVNLRLELSADLLSSVAYVNGSTVPLTNPKITKKDQTATSTPQKTITVGRYAGSTDTHDTTVNSTVIKDLKLRDLNGNLLVSYDFTNAVYWYDLSGNENHLISTRSDATPVPTAQFKQSDNYPVADAAGNIPETISAWIKLPTSYSGKSSRAHTILSNFVDNHTEGLSLEVHNYGYPRVYLKRNVDGYNGNPDIKSVREECKWTINVADGKWHHLEFVIGDGVDNILCYVDGVLITEKALNKADHFTGYGTNGVLAENPNPLHIGTCRQSGTSRTYFKGFIGSVAAYSDLRTADEVAATFAAIDGNYRRATANYSDPDLLYAYDTIDDYAENLAAAQAISATSATLLYESMIQIRYAFTAKGEAAKYGMLVFANAEDALTRDPAKAVQDKELSKEGGLYYGFTDGIAAKDMGDSQFVVGYMQLDDGTFIYTNTVEYSPKIYAERMVAKDTSTAETKALCKALMSYGAAAQIYFNYKTDDLMNAGFETVAFDAAVMGESIFAVDKTPTNGFTAKSATLLFNGAITYRIKYDVDASIADKVLYLEYTMNGETKSAALTLDGDGYYAFIEDVAAKDMDEKVVIRPYYLDENGEKVYGAELSYSGYEYARRTVANSTNEDSVALAKAFAMYVSAADKAILA